MTDVDLIEDAYAQGLNVGRERERNELMQHLAQRVDELDATWQTIERPTYEECVAARIREMEAAAANWPAFALEHIRRHYERDAVNVRRGGGIDGGKLAHRLERNAAACADASDTLKRSA